MASRSSQDTSTTSGFPATTFDPTHFIRCTPSWNSFKDTGPDESAYCPSVYQGTQNPFEGSTVDDETGLLLGSVRLLKEHHHPSIHETDKEIMASLKKKLASEEEIRALHKFRDPNRKVAPKIGLSLFGATDTFEPWTPSTILPKGHTMNSSIPPSDVDPRLQYPPGCEPLPETDHQSRLYDLDFEERAALGRFLSGRSRSPTCLLESEEDKDLVFDLAESQSGSFQTDEAPDLPSQKQSTHTSSSQLHEPPYRHADLMEVDDVNTNHNDARDNSIPQSLVPQPREVSSTNSQVQTGGMQVTARNSGILTGGRKKKRPPQGYISQLEIDNMRELSGEQTLTGVDVRMTRAQRRQLGL